MMLIPTYYPDNPVNEKQILLIILKVEVDIHVKLPVIYLFLLCPKRNGLTWRMRRHVASFHHPEVSGGRSMIAMVEEFPPV